MIPEQLTMAAGLVVGAGFPIFGILVYWLVKATYDSESERPDSMPSAHGRDRRL